MQSLAFVAEALDRLRVIDGQLAQASGSEKSALQGARAELLKVIEIACRFEPMPLDPTRSEPTPQPGIALSDRKLAA